MNLLETNTFVSTPLCVFYSHASEAEAFLAVSLVAQAVCYSRGFLALCCDAALRSSTNRNLFGVSRKINDAASMKQQHPT